VAITVPVLHKDKPNTVQIDLTSTFYSFQVRLEEPMSVPVENQRLLFKEKKASAKDANTLGGFGLKCGTRVQTVGSTVEEIGDLRAVDSEPPPAGSIIWRRDGRL
jgi:hypothetical protein